MPAIPAQGRGLVALLLLLLLTAGCASHAAPGRAAGQTSASTPSAIEEDRGAVVGTVVNEEQLPIAAARVEILGTSEYTLTDLDGHYEFRSLLPGNYQIDARIGENEPVTKQVTVAVGETATVDFVLALKRSITELPYHTTAIVKGHMGCDVAGQACPGYPNTNDKRAFQHAFDGRPASLLYEMTWIRFGPGPPPGLYDDNQPGWIHRWDFDARSSNVQTHKIAVPPYMRVNITIDKSIAAKSPVAVTVTSHPVGFLQNPGFAYEQDFTIYMTSFHLRDDSGTFCAAPPESCTA